MESVSTTALRFYIYHINCQIFETHEIICATKMAYEQSRPYHRYICIRTWIALYFQDTVD